MLFDPEMMPTWIREHFSQGPSYDALLSNVDEDDCGIIQLGQSQLVVSTDYINSQPAIIELGIGSWYDLGRLVVAQNLSDLAGSGAEPLALMLGVCLPPSSSQSDCQDVIRGAKFEADTYHVPIAGGDTKVGQTRSIYGVAIGYVNNPRSLLLRSRARVGDGVWVSGCLGSFAASVLALNNNTRVSVDIQDWAKHTLLNPRVPLSISRQIALAATNGAGTDITDGLWKDTSAVCQSSSVHGTIFPDLIPIAPEVAEIAASFGVLPWTFAFASGGDFQFICTADTSYSSVFSSFGMIRIGEINAGFDVGLQLKDGRYITDINPGHRSNRDVSFAHEILRIVTDVSQL